MKKFFAFLLGVVVGFLLAYGFSYLNSKDSPEEQNTETKEVEKPTKKETKPQLPEGVTLFDEAGDVIKEKSFKVLQVIEADAALAHGKDEFGYYSGTLYLLTNSDKKYYYDEEIVNVPQGKVVRQIGIYRYVTGLDMVKTVPIVKIMDK